MIASTTWKPGTRQHTARSESGHTIQFDTSPSREQGPTPMEAVLAALCGCTAVDVVNIMEKKRQPMTSLVVSAEAEQASSAPHVFTRIRLTYKIGGAVSRKAAQDAVALSKEKYCSVSIMLAAGVAIEYTIDYTPDHADGEPPA